MTDDIWYHGIGNGAGARPIIVEDAAGNMLGTVDHVAHHSPTGMSWGYSGSGAADCARSILIAALGPERARCAACQGTGCCWSDYNEGEEPPVYAGRPSPDQAAKAGAGLHAFECHCFHGYIDLPYQQFKSEFVAGWGAEFRISQAAILTWLAAHGVEQAA
jgi:hypothetical protein